VIILDNTGNSFFLDPFMLITTITTKKIVIGMTAWTTKKLNPISGQASQLKG